MPTSYRPRFVLWTAVLRQLPLQLFLTIWASLFFGGIFAMFRAAVAVAATRPGQPVDWIATLFTGPAAVGTIVFFGFPFVVVGAKWLNYRNTSYTVDGDHITVSEGFWTVQSKRVLIEDVREVILRRGPLQRLSGVGSVYPRIAGAGRGLGLARVGDAGRDQPGRERVMLMDLPDWRTAYEAMQARLTPGGPGPGTRA